MADPDPATPAPAAPALATYDDFSKIELRVAKVLEARPHPNADKLMLLQIDVGDDCVREYGGVQPADTTLGVPTDLLVPAAREDVVDDGIALATSAKLLVEGANLPTTRSAREEVYAEQRAESLARAAAALGNRGDIVVGQEPAELSPSGSGTR